MQKLTTKKKIIRTVIVLLAITLFLLLIYLILVWTGLWEKLNSVEKLKNLILSLGIWGRITFVVFQFLQVTFIPVPSPMLILAGSLIYGPLQAGLLSLAGILLGSGFAFFLGRTFGKKLVTFMVGEESQRKWTKLLGECKYSFVIMMLLPCFPDDILCLVAGLTDMSWTFFMVTQFISRPIGIFSVSYLTSGEIIPYSGWGLAVWAVIIIASLTLIYLSIKYNRKIENFKDTTIELNERFKELGKKYSVSTTFYNECVKKYKIIKDNITERAPKKGERR